MKSLKKVFAPLKIGTIEIKNRFAMAPMATCFCTHDGFITQKVIDYYTARAKGGIGLIITEVVSVVSTSAYMPNQMTLFDDKYIPGLKKLTDSVHAYGAKIAPQLIHAGGENWEILSGHKSVGPSPVLSRSKGDVPRELSNAEIEAIIECFGDAARRARDAGFDCVELHAAHAHMLVGAFMSPLRNKRSDAYGGSIEGRLKLPLEIIKNIKEKAGNDYPIILRTSGDELLPGGRTLQETQFIAPILEDAGVDAFHISGGVYPDQFWRIIPPMGTPLASNTPFATGIKEVVEVPVIAVGRIHSPRLAEHIVSTGKADMVALGRPLLADPDFVNKAYAGRFDDIIPCISCGIGCIQQREKMISMTCLMNPRTGKESEPGKEPAKRVKKIIVVGGGPAGLTAARVAALRGHDVTLYEKASKLGGQFRIAVVPPFKQDIAVGLKFIISQAEKSNIKIVFNAEVTVELIKQKKPDAVIIATGAVPFIPEKLPGVDRKMVVTAEDILDGHPSQGCRNIVVLGGGLAGPEVADFLADRGDNLAIKRKSVTIVTSKKDIALNLLHESRALLMQRLRDKDVRIMTRTTAKEILEDSVIVSCNGQDHTISKVDCVVLARGVKKLENLSEKIRECVPEVIVIGDAKEPRMALEAIAEGTEIGSII